MDPVSLLIAATVIALGIVIFRKVRGKASRSTDPTGKVWLEQALPVVSDPNTDPAVLLSYLTMENPHDFAFYSRLEALRALARNPGLSPELQAAAINRVTQEETAAHLDKSLRKMRGGVGGFVGVNVPL